MWLIKIFGKVWEGVWLNADKGEGELIFTVFLQTSFMDDPIQLMQMNYVPKRSRDRADS